MLTSASPSQVITLKNNGNTTISNLSFSGYGSIGITQSASTCNTPLLAGSSCSFTASASGRSSGQAGMVLNYNNLGTAASANSSINFNIIYLATNSGPALSMTSGQGSLLNTPQGTTTYFNLVVGNLGNSSLNNITFTNPALANAALSFDGSSSCATNGSQSLSASESCTLVIKYAPSSVTAANSFTLHETAQWSDPAGFQQTYANASLLINYSAVAGNALLNISPNYVAYAIRADNLNLESQTYTVTNYGLATTTIDSISLPLVTALSNTSSGGGSCTIGSILAASGGSCTITTQFGPTLSTINTSGQALSLTYKPNSTSPDESAVSPMALTSQPAALINVTNVSTSGSSFNPLDNNTGLVSAPYAFYNSATTAMVLTFTYSNNGTASATNFNVALNNLPVGYYYNAGGTTCGIGGAGVTIPAGGSCTVQISAESQTQQFNPYAYNGPLNVNIPGYSYTDTNSGVNSQSFPIWSGSYANSNTIYVSSVVYINGSQINTPVVWTTGTAGGSNNLTFNAGYPLTCQPVFTIPAGQLGGFTLGGGGTCTVTSNPGNCTISVTNPAGVPLISNYFRYWVNSTCDGTPNGNNSITQYGSFSYSS